jgi:hypothetical protein
VSARLDGRNVLTAVRSMYLDIAEWADDDPRWVPWAVHCPVSASEVSHKKDRSRRKSRMDQRTRDRLPVLPALAAWVDAERKATAGRLQAAQDTAAGALFTTGGQTLRRSAMKTQTTGRTWAEDPRTGKRRDLTFEEHRGFWVWAAVEVLRFTGIRIEELTELSHHSLIQYRLPGTGELIPLLQITPSKTDEERLLVISPELADVLSTIMSRIRGTRPDVPLVVSYDKNERIYNPPMPLLFQWRCRLENRAVGETSLRKYLDDALTAIGVKDATGRTLRYTFHDFRRIFITDAIMHGMPPHIAQLVAGHRDVNTTMGYKAVYPEEVINGHRAFIARRRALRPSGEYRTPTDQEWSNFLGLPVNCTSSGSLTGHPGPGARRVGRGQAWSAERVRHDRGHAACADGGATVGALGGGGHRRPVGAVAVLRRGQRRRGSRAGERVPAGSDARGRQPAHLP